MPPTKKRKGGKPPSADARRGKKKVSILTQEKIEYIDWKDVNLLRRFVSDRAKIRARRVTGNSAQQQRDVAMAIKNAREMALLPYTNRITTQRGGRGGDRRSRDDNRPPREDRDDNRPPREDRPVNKDPEPQQAKSEAPIESDEPINTEVPLEPEVQTSAPQATETPDELITEESAE